MDNVCETSLEFKCEQKTQLGENKWGSPESSRARNVKIKVQGVTSRAIHEVFKDKASRKRLIRADR